MPFKNQIVGGDFLVRNQIESENYVAGTSGWIIKRDGTVEFNNGTFRGSIEVGPLTGAHFIVNNAGTGDIIDVYNSSDQLVFKIDSSGRVFSQDPVSQRYVEMDGGFIEFGTAGLAAPWTNASLIANSTSSTSYITLDSGLASNLATDSRIRCYDSFAGAGTPFVEGYQRGTSGTVLQTDVSDGTNNLVRTFTGSGVTDAGGRLNIATGASFPIVHASVTYDQTGIGGGVWCAGTYYDVATGHVGTQWWTNAGAFASSTVHYRGTAFG